MRNYAIASLIGFMASNASAQSALTMSVQLATGHTPDRVGYNIHAQSTPAPWTWIRHSEVNAARVWFGSDFDVQPTGSASHADTRSEFIFHRQNTRTELNEGPLGNTSAANCSVQLTAATPSAWVDWNFVINEWENEGYRATFDEAILAGVQPHIQLTLSRSKNPLQADPEYWQSRWELWRHVFASAYYAAWRWNVATWQIFNEPNKLESDGGVPKDEFIERLRLASDAIQLAIKTINKRRTYCGGPTLTANILAPTTTSNPHIYVDPSHSEAWDPPAPQPLATGTGGVPRAFCDPAIVNSSGGHCRGPSRVPVPWTGSRFEVSNGAVDDAWTAFWTPTSGSYPISSLGFADFTGDGVTDIFLSGQP